MEMSQIDLHESLMQRQVYVSNNNSNNNDIKNITIQMNAKVDLFNQIPLHSV